jgi:uncharacterized cysteine cluster protein YcgN (CxxCxxCC family)
MTGRRFWEEKPLAAFTTEEWEATCDGCAKCCLVKLEDEDEPDTLYFTDVACRLLDLATCRCTDYANRTTRVPGCARLSPDRLDLLAVMPPSCAYRRLAEGRGLPAWHHLVSGDPATIHAAGHSVRGRVASELDIAADDLEDRLVDWPFVED